MSLLPELFSSHAKGRGKRKRVSGRPSCKKALKAEYNAQCGWKNPECWRNDYPLVKQWRDQNPGYLKQYRANLPEYLQKNQEAQRQRDQRKKDHPDTQA